MKQWYECPKCKCKNSLGALRARENGIRLALYCTCGHFIKWANEEERFEIEKQNEKLVLNSIYGALGNKEAIQEFKDRHQILTLYEQWKIKSEYYALPEPDSAECFIIVEV